MQNEDCKVMSPGDRRFCGHFAFLIDHFSFCNGLTASKMIHKTLTPQQPQKSPLSSAHSRGVTRQLTSNRILLTLLQRQSFDVTNALRARDHVERSSEYVVMGGHL
jgi:hypothetical protein